MTAKKAHIAEPMIKSPAQPKIKARAKSKKVDPQLLKKSAKKVRPEATQELSVKVGAASEIAPPLNAVDADQDAHLQVKVSEKDFIRRLTEKLTHFDATMVLEAAMLTAGVPRQDGNFKKRDAREICLALIKRGGPAFSVGTGIYREVIG